MNLVKAGPQKFALQRSIRNAALKRSGLKTERRDRLRLEARPHRDASCRWSSPARPGPRRRPSPATGRTVFAPASARTTAKKKILQDQRSVVGAGEAQHNELQRVDAKLVKLMPIVYHGVLRFDAPNGNLPGTDQSGPPPVPEQGSVHALNLAFLRIQLLSSITELGNAGGRLPLRARSRPTCSRPS